MASWRNVHVLSALSLMALLGGCGSSESSDSEDDYTAAVTWRPVSFAVPAAHAKQADKVIFSNERDFRNYFGTSCGLLCTNKYAGAMPVSMDDPSGKTRTLVYINRADVPPGKSLAIKSITSEQWGYLTVATCTKPAASGTAYALAVADAKGEGLVLNWMNKPSGTTGLEACP